MNKLLPTMVFPGCAAINWLKAKPRVTRTSLIVFYLVGWLGMAIPAFTPLFIHLTPFALLVSFFILAVYHEKPLRLQTVIIFLVIYGSGYLIEMIGVNTHLIFGHYEYGQGLGFKLWNTPVIIGLNWLLLTYTSSAMVEKLPLPSWVQILLASLLMVVYDMVMEQVAPLMDMWYWLNSTIPVQNYLAWWIIATIFQILLRVFRLKITNPMALTIFLCQFFFFLLLFITFQLRP
ncbi:carotenoid biosynthesis protein [Marinilabiliaceae bacterium JC017]|nr:carotenoid biosynthesis protein [Marinilabiliaceae bacterium JC017]